MQKFIYLGSEIKLNLPKMMEQKVKAVSSLTKGIEMLFKKNKVTRFVGHGKLVDKNKVEIIGSDGKVEQIEAKNIVIATGSDFFEISGLQFDEKTIISSTGALDLKEVPKKMVVIGGGVIGLELVKFIIFEIYNGN
jgi:dihydrolipoamide dehydrogenase